jgi:hypothetical protein
MVDQIAQGVIYMTSAIAGNAQQNKASKLQLATSKEQAAYYQQLADIQKTRLSQLQADLAKPPQEKKTPAWVWYAIGGGAALVIGVLIYFITRKK